MKRLPASERTKEEMRRLMSEGGAGDPKSELVRLGIRRAVEETLEAVVRDLLGGRGFYERRGDGAEGSRNGYRERGMKTAEGEVRYAAPQVRDVPADALSAIREHLAGRTDELERLGIEMYARGCSTRDVEAIFRDENGRSLLSRTAVSEITEALWKEYEEFATRDLSEVRPLYLFLDGIAQRLRPGAAREAVLAAWAITEEGRKVLVHVTPGTKESTECCRAFIEEMKRRGLGDPVLVVSDGAPGIIRAIEECFPASRRQRCLVHKMRNLANKLPEDLRAEFQAAAKASYEAPSTSMAQALRADLVARFGKRVPSAVACFEEDFDACAAHLDCPPAHRKIIRTTNLIERLFEEERRRTNAARTMFGERAVLKLSYAAMIRASETWRGVSITEFEQKQLERLREQLQEEHRRRHAPAVTKNEKSGSTPSRVSSSQRT